MSEAGFYANPAVFSLKRLSLRCEPAIYFPLFGLSDSLLDGSLITTLGYS
jgi:hypothetical protein